MEDELAPHAAESVNDVCPAQVDDVPVGDFFSAVVATHGFLLADDVEAVLEIARDAGDFSSRPLPALQLLFEGSPLCPHVVAGA